MFSKKCLFSHAIIVMIMAGTGVINAQSTNDYIDYGESGEELVITVGRTSEASKNVPAQVTVITADDIVQSGAVSVVNVLETVPGIRFTGAMSGAGSEGISMRGFGENSYGRVLVLIDGNKINDPDMKAANWNAIPLSSIERIEILDGSASVQYGNYAVGGVINIITKKSGKRLTTADAAGGSFFYNREAVSHFQPLSWGNFLISAEHTGTKGYRERQASETVNTYGSSSIFISDSIRISFNGYFSWLNFQLPGALPLDQFKDNPKQASNFEDENNEFHFGGGFSFLWTPTENVALVLPLSYLGKSIKADMASYPTFTDRTVHSAEARPQGSITFDISGMPLRLLGGVDLYYMELGVDDYGNKNRTGSPSNTYTISEWTIGPYIMTRFSPLSNLSFSVGIRFDTAIIKADNPTSKDGGEKTYHAFVYDAGIVYNPLDELKIYARYAALFRYPFVDELVSVMTGSITPDLKPEKGFNAEIGSSVHWEKFINLSVNFFFMQLEDEIAFNMGSYLNENLDKTWHWGANISLNLTPADWVSFDASYSLVNAVFSDGDNKDKRIPLVPMHKIYASLMFHLPFGLSFGPDIEYASDRYYSGDNPNAYDPIDSYFLLGARVRHVLDIKEHHFAFQVTAKNLLSTQYVTFGFPGYVYPEDGLSINVSMNYRF
ncbi:MAG: TonB-dependent receptor [Treponema sp.]|jgi:iron complex outermembrane receptor protein|nr:TonB-dependent receptor [Treponema sp.]